MSSSLVPPPAGATTQQSISGTPRNRLGWTSPDDYVLDLGNPEKRIQIFEEMGQSDHAVHTAIEARRQEISSANWLLASEDESDQGKEILQFCEDNLYPLLDQLLRQLGGGAIQYGFGVVEPIFAWNDEPFTPSIQRDTVRRSTKASGRRLYLKKLAHIRQTAVTTFKIDPEKGDLVALVQWIFNGIEFKRVEIPAEKLLLWVYDQQGDDHWGVPPTRHCYKAWSFKQQLERLNLLSFDKFGVGTPIATEPEGGLTEPERSRLATYLKNWRAGAAEYVIQPFGATVEIKSGDGKTVMSALEWVKAYNLAIAKTYLTQATELGSTETGARALGETFFEQLSGIVQGDCEEIASLVNNRLLVPLVKWNFGPQTNYPAFAPSQRVRVGTGVASVLKTLIDSGAVHVRPEDEAYLRDVFELPAVELATLQQEQTTRDAATIAARAAANANAGNGNGDNPNGDSNNNPPPAPRPQPQPVAADRRDLLRELRTELAAGAPTPAAAGTSWRTPQLSEWEQTILRPDVLARDLDVQTSRLTGEVKDVLASIDQELERQVSAVAGRGLGALASSVATIRVPSNLRDALRTVMLDAAARARDYGVTAVRAEIKRQIGPQGIGPNRAPSYAPGFYGRLTRVVAKIRALAQTPDDLSARDHQLNAEVDRAVEEEIDRREQSARSAVLTAIAQAAGADPADLAAVVSTAAAAALVGLATSRTEQNVQGVVNVGFGVGRQDAAEAIVESDGSGAGAIVDTAGAAITLVSKVYSAVLDFGTCEECAKWDGALFPIDYPEDYTGVQCPNPRCAGGYARCRCVWIYVTDAESVPSAPAAKGPLPLSREDVDKAIALAVKPVLEQLAARQSGAGTQPVQLVVNIERDGRVVEKTITRGADGQYTVTEKRAE